MDSDYQSLGDDAFNESGADGLNGRDAIEQLNKSLSVGYGYNLTDKTGGGAIRLESIDDTLKIITSQEKTAAFWMSAPKKKAESTVEEYTNVNEVDGAQFYAEGGVPEEAQDDLARAYEQVKYLGAIGKISDVISVTRNQTNARALEQANKTRAMVRLADKTGWFGHTAWNTLQYDGIIRQVERKLATSRVAQHIIDLRGKRLNLTKISQGVTTICDNYGDGDNIQLWCSPRAKQGYFQDLTANQQFFVNNGSPNQVIGIDASRFQVTNGDGLVKRDVFMGQYPDRDPWPKLNTAGNAFVATHAKAPATPTNTSSTIANGTVGYVPAATYDYAITAVNRFGASAPLVAGNVAGIVMAANKQVTFLPVDGSSTSGQEATSFRVYRRVAGGGLTDYHFLFEVGATDACVDDGTWLPDTDQSVMIEWNSDQVFAFHQLLPMFKKPLAPIGDYEWWLQKLYVTPIVYNPNRIIIFRNVGLVAN